MYASHFGEPHATAPSFERPLDLVHLARQTLGDRDLEREILDLFVLQAGAMVKELRSAEARQARMDFAHTLKGSARAVGAWKVASQAETCETHAGGEASIWAAAVDTLACAVQEACGAIAALQRTH